MAGALAPIIITSGASAQLGGGDECASAVVIAADTATNFDTTTATASGNIPTDALCAGTYLNWVATCKDVWFKFTATGPGTADFSTCATATYDTSLALYKGNCATLVACNGDDGACAGFTSKIAAVPCNTGDVFYLRIGGYAGTTTTPEGDFGAGSVIVAFTASSAGCIGATGACNVVHVGVGCDNPVCCTNICNFNPLCCEIGWDQGCVDLAIELCGYYSCPVVAGAPVNNCATSPTTIPSVSSSRTFTTVGATTDGPVTDGALCNSGSDNFFGDIWYRVSPIANGTMTVSTCDSVSFDNKLAVYNLGATPATFDYNLLSTVLVGCNDDGASGVCNTTEAVPTTFASEMSVAVTLGNTYLVRMGSFSDADRGTGTIRFTLPAACVLDTSNVNESEPCGSATDNGCNAAGESQPISIGSIVAGTLWADTVAGVDTRDSDFYSFSVAAGSQVTLSVKAARLVNVLILSGDINVAACAGISVLASGAGTCPTVSTYCLNAGVYYAFVSDSAFTGNPCGSGAFNDYTLSLTSTPATCPILVSGGGAANGTCTAPGPDTMTLNVNPTLGTGGLVACAVNPAFPNCGTGGGTANSYARVFPAGTVGGNISCINFGVFSVRRAVNGAACASFYSDIPLPATIGIYQDLDGGAPRFKTVNNGADGGDLAMISEQAVLVPGGAYVATLNFAQPICVDQYRTKNLVVIMDCPDLYAGVSGVPAASGYGIRASGNTPSPAVPSNTYCRLSCADTALAYVLTETVGATFTAQWVVAINGNNAASCSAPSCPGDFNGDRVRNGADLATMLSAWGTAGGDINGDSTTNGADLAGLLSGWGACPN